MILSLRFSMPCITRKFDSSQVFRNTRSVVVCAAKGPRPRYPRVWKTKNRIGTISKSAKLVDCIKELSNVKEEVYGALDSFIAWELEFPLITVKKALKTLEGDKEWKRIIQVTKWMLSKGQGRTNGSYFMLLNALEQDDRIGEAEELWEKLFSDNLNATPRIFFDKMISIYYRRGLHDKMFEVFADMEELGMKPTITTTNMVGEVFQQLGMVDKYEKLVKKYPTPKWEYRYIKGKRVRIGVNQLRDTSSSTVPRLAAGNDNEVVGQQQLKEDVISADAKGETESNNSDRDDERIEEELREFVDDDIRTVSG